MKLSGFNALALSLLFTVVSGFNAANADLITHNEYTLDEDTDIVTGGGLEWLQWDVTTRLSVNSALAANGSFGGVNYGTGWTLATNEQMAALFMAFTFNSTTTDEFTNTTLPYTSLDDSEMDKFIELFGTTLLTQGGIFGTGDNALRSTHAIYGTPRNSTIPYNRAEVFSDWTVQGAPGEQPSLRSNGANMYALDQGPDDSTFFIGVALVREIDVPEPSTVAILAMGLLGLCLRRKLRA